MATESSATLGLVDPQPMTMRILDLTGLDSLILSVGWSAE
jgi:anti-anti-sigma regulatory factor